MAVSSSNALISPRWLFLTKPSQIARNQWVTGSGGRHVRAVFGERLPRTEVIEVMIGHTTRTHTGDNVASNNNTHTDPLTDTTQHTLSMLLTVISFSPYVFKPYQCYCFCELHPLLFNIMSCYDYCPHHIGSMLSPYFSLHIRAHNFWRKKQMHLIRVFVQCPPITLYTHTHIHKFIWWMWPLLRTLFTPLVCITYQIRAYVHCVCDTIYVIANIGSRKWK